MVERTVFGWRQVAAILASQRDSELLAAMGIPLPAGQTRFWARKLLDEVEDFWEVYDVEPDGGAAARRIEAELRPLAGDPSMVGLTEACEILSRSLDDRENLSQWLMLLEELSSRQDEPIVAPPAGLAGRVRDVLTEIDWPRTDHIDLPETIEDDWEFGFRYDAEVEADGLADQVVETRFVERVLAHLTAALTAAEQSDLVAWANAESDAWQGEPRPAIWPPKKPLALDPTL